MNFVRVFLLSVFLSFGAQAQLALDSMSISRRIYNNLTGKILRVDSQIAQDMRSKIDQSDFTGAAQIALSDDAYIDVVVRRWAANLITNNNDPLLELNDSMAFLIGLTRDNLSAKNILTGNFIYGINPKFGFGRPKVNSNTDFSSIDQGVRPLRTSLYKYTPQWDISLAQDAGGILTTRYWSSVNYSAGTNRRVVHNTLEIFLCKPTSSWKIPNLPTYRIRQDIDRFPAGNAQTFQTECRACHSVMDGLSGAFSKINYDNGTVVWSSSVFSKYTQHADVYVDGYITEDSTWINFIQDKSGVLDWGWKTPTQGQGINQLGQMLSESEAFSSCMINTIFKSICKKDIGIKSSEGQALLNKWKANDLKLEDAFIEVSVSPSCLN